MRRPLGRRPKTVYPSLVSQVNAIFFARTAARETLNRSAFRNGRERCLRAHEVNDCSAQTDSTWVPPGMHGMSA
jgi:hypothetical protein